MGLPGVVLDRQRHIVTADAVEAVQQLVQEEAILRPLGVERRDLDVVVAQVLRVGQQRDAAGRMSGVRDFDLQRLDRALERFLA